MGKETRESFAAVTPWQAWLPLADPRGVCCPCTSPGRAVMLLLVGCVKFCGGGDEKLEKCFASSMEES